MKRTLSSPSKNGRANGLLNTVTRRSGYWRANEATTGSIMATSPMAEKRIMRRRFIVSDPYFLHVAG